MTVGILALRDAGKMSWIILKSSHHKEKTFPSFSFCLFFFFPQPTPQPEQRQIWAASANNSRAHSHARSWTPDWAQGSNLRPQGFPVEPRQEPSPPFSYTHTRTCMLAALTIMLISQPKSSHQAVRLQLTQQRVSTTSQWNRGWGRTNEPPFSQINPSRHDFSNGQNIPFPRTDQTLEVQSEQGARKIVLNHKKKRLLEGWLPWWHFGGTDEKRGPRGGLAVCYFMTPPLDFCSRFLGNCLCPFITFLHKISVSFEWRIE